MDTLFHTHPRSVVITGSSSGIGRASALLLVERGFQVGKHARLLTMLARVRARRGAEPDLRAAGSGRGVSRLRRRASRVT